ncbi:glycosyltransferase family 4 protein [Sphingomonas sp.]|jgi:glycosyltransferase involved in cell wall biosynthesis|uniref:glycosyltransferase family 4 protein n=1 Tax=Sphingomonas sp. TaxID=28214 RepID=UPI002E301DA3|nr:glycosyltransferase family 4 protein [Sphingomonas sp.]HEX4695452.1 glycosyltransferase family 4 protein [Sphingomonas sp.]
MKIALVVPGGVDRSGSERVIPCLLWLIERLVRSGDEVHVFALGQEPRPGRWQLLGAEVRNAGARPRRLRTLAGLLAEHRRGRFGIVHAFWAGAPGVAAAAFARLTHVPLIVSLPGGDLIALPEIDYGLQLTRRGRFWTCFTLSTAAQITVRSEWMRAEAAVIGVEATCIPIGVALDRWPLRPPQRRGAGQQLRLLHVANLNRVKDQETLLQAMVRLRERGVAFRLDMIGLDTLGGAVQRRCTALGLDDHVVFHGFMPHAEMRPWFEQADLLVMSSRHETGPVTAIEAGVVGVPTVGTAVGLIADWAPDAAISVLVGDGAGLGTAIEQLAEDEDARMLLAYGAQEAARHQDADLTTMQFRRLYAELAA